MDDATSARLSQRTEGLEVTDCSLWRTQHRLSEGRTEEQTDRETSADSSRLDVTDSSLWRTKVAAETTVGANGDAQQTEQVEGEAAEEANESSTTTTILNSTFSKTAIESEKDAAEKETPSQCVQSEAAAENDIEVTDCSCWRTQVGGQPESAETTEESSGLHLTDCSLWRTKVDVVESQPRSSQGTQSSGVEVPDCSLWRTFPRPSDGVQSNGATEEGRTDGVDVTDCSLWRTHVRLSELRLDSRGEDATIPTDSSRFEMTDNSLWRTKVGDGVEAEAEKQVQIAPKVVDFTQNEDEESTVGSLPLSTSIGRPTARKSRVSMRLSSLHPVDEEAEKSAEHSTAFVGLQSPTDVTMRTAETDRTARRSSAARSLGYAESTVASRTRSVTNQSVEATPEGRRSCNKQQSPLDRMRMPRESVEVFTQTSGQKTQLMADERRRTLNPLTQHFRPISPGRRATLMNPPRLPTARPSVYAPFFSRLSSGSEHSSRKSVDLERSATRSPSVSKIPAPSARLPSTPQSSPRLVDRVRMREALKMAGTTPKSTRSRLPTRSPATPEAPKSGGDALRRIFTDYATPVRNFPPAPTERPAALDFSADSMASPPRRVADSLFETSNETPKSGRIESQPLRLAADFRALQWNEDAAGSLFNSAPDAPVVESQPIGSQLPPRPPFRLLNDDDLCTSTPPASSRKMAAKTPVAQPVCSLPESVRFDDHTPLDLSVLEVGEAAEETAGVSFAAGGSDEDSDVGSPAPKHIVLRNTKHNIVGSENDNPNPALRRSTRTRLTRACNRGLGERPIYERDADGNFRLVGVQEGRTADPLCKKWGTFDKDKAMQMEREATKRRRAAKQQNKEKWEREFPRLPPDSSFV